MDGLELIERALHSLRSDTWVRAELAVATAIVVAVWNANRKKRRLRDAIRIEIELTSRAHRESYTAAMRADLEGLIRTDPAYNVTIFTSHGHLIIANLDDDVAFMHPRTMRRIILFDDRVRLIEDVLRYMRTAEFAGLSVDRKLAILAIPFDAQDELQGYAMQLIGEL